jgi:hypothetical protein
MSVDEMSVDEMSVHKIYVDEISVDEKSVDEIPVDQTSVDEMSVDEMSIGGNDTRRMGPHFFAEKAKQEKSRKCSLMDGSCSKCISDRHSIFTSISRRFLLPPVHETRA